MKINSTILKACLVWAFVCSISLVAGAAGRVAGSFSKPDFAYPADVAANAREVLKRSRAEHNDVDALKAAMQLVMASNYISQEKAPEGIALFDTLSRELRAPYSGLALLLEAKLYREMYQDQMWEYNQRKLPPTPVPSNPLEWDRDMYSSKVTSLVAKAAAVGRGKISIGKITPILTDYQEALENGLTVADFIDMEGMEILAMFYGDNTALIPFYPEKARGNKQTELTARGLAEKLSENLRGRYAGIAPNGASAMVDRYCLEEMSGVAREKFLDECLKRYGKTRWGGSFLLVEADGVDDMASRKKVCRSLESYLKSFPESKSATAIRNRIFNLKASDIRTETSSQYLTTKPITGNYDISNLKDFYLLCVKLTGSNLGKYVDKTSVKAGVAVANLKIKDLTDSIAPFLKKGEFSFPAQEQGVYVIAASTTPDLKGLIWDTNANRKVSTFMVSNISLLEVEAGRNKAEANRLIVVEGTNQSPVKGADATFTSWGRPNQTYNAVSDGEGQISIPKGNYEVRVTRGKDVAVINANGREYYGSDNDGFVEGKLFTDLSIYHPGDSIGFAGIVYKGKNKNLKPWPNKTVMVILKDANYENRDTVSVTTDEFGRFQSKMWIPTDGLLGMWRMIMKGEENLWRSQYFEVAEYKAPKFIVTVDGPTGETVAGQPLKISGEVRTYSGMPVIGGKVAYEIRYSPIFWRMYAEPVGNARYGGETVTDETGKFTIELPTEGLLNTPYSIGRYELRVEATDQAGETQAADPMLFYMGEGYRIVPKIPALYNQDKPQRMTVTVYDLAGRPAQKEVDYRMYSIPENREVATGKLTNADFVPAKDLVPGKYRVVFTLAGMDTTETKATAEVVIYNNEIKRPPVNTPLWLPETQIIVKENQQKVEVKMGSSYEDSYLYAVAYGSKGIIRKEWLKVSDGMVAIDIDAPKGEERVKLIVSGMHDLNRKMATVILIPELQTKKLEIKSESFRDQITPGAVEHWRFSFRFDGKPAANIPVMSVMTDKALNAIAPFSWDFNPYGQIPRYIDGNISGLYRGSTAWSISPDAYRKSPTPQYTWPDWNLYGYSSLYEVGLRSRSLKLRGGGIARNLSNDGRFQAVMEQVIVKEEGSDGAPMLEESSVVYSAKKSAAMAGKAVTTEDSMDEEDAGQTAQECLRPNEYPLAFFMPMLTTDSIGEAAVDFRVPDFNGTWQLQMMGYIPDGMRGTVEAYESRASKPVMVSLNAPRFVRTGDKVCFTATGYNNSPDTATLAGRLEIADAVTGKILMSKADSPKRVAPMGAFTMTGEWTVPSDLESVYLRAYAEGADHRDGEQAMVPVLPSSTPVIESTTFYMPGSEKKLSLDVPSGKEGSVNTFDYCDNPVWDCLLALPQLSQPYSENALSLAAACYGNSMANGIINGSTRVAEALKIYFETAAQENKAPTGNLESNPELKTVALINTPWVRNAEAETMRIRALEKYLDQKSTEALIKSCYSALSKLQRGDGGWSWCPGMSSSEFITERVLENLAMVANAGYLPAVGKEMAKKAVPYLDGEYVKYWKKIGKDTYNYMNLIPYLYIRRNFDVPENSEFQTMHQLAIEAMSDGWKRTGIETKATIAILLNQEGRKAESREILESLRQYAMVKPEKGMWFDNLSSGYGGMNKVLITSRVLEAYADIEPSAEEVDQLRQWLVLTKQTEDWGAQPGLAQTINAIMKCGSEWSLADGKLKIKIDGKQYELSAMEKLTGKIVINLAPDAKNIQISRSLSVPAWGGLISQYVAPIGSVKAASTPELSVTKQLFTISADSTGTVASGNTFKPGDKVRILLTVKCDRDMDYVAITDSRGAFLEPAEQISGYTQSDGIWMYKEIRNSSTNLFIPFLPKGVHQISYECYADRAGEYSLGIATAQSQYAPQITAHSAGELIKVGGGK